MWELGRGNMRKIGGGRGKRLEGRGKSGKDWRWEGEN
jgi:hypothetical protein